MYFPSDGYRLSSVQHFINSMNFPRYGNYKDIGLPPPSSDFVYDYSNVHSSTQPPALILPSSSSLHHGHPSNEGNFGQGHSGHSGSQSKGLPSTNSYNPTLPPSHLGAPSRDDDSGDSSQGKETKRRGRPKGSKSKANDNRQRPFGCTTCNKWFITRQNLQQHEGIHTRNYKYRCTVCDKAYVQLTQLTQHLKSAHSKPYECHVCKKSFFEPSHLYQHSREHTGDPRPYNCPVCQRKFTSKKQLDKHMDKTHPPPVS